MRAETLDTFGTVVERLASLGVPLWTHPDWQQRFPWLVQGTTGRGQAEEPWDLGLGGSQPVGRVLDRWRRLREALGMPAAVHSRQVHGAELCVHGPSPPTSGLLVIEGADGHLTRCPGLLLTVSVADCVPVFLVDARRRSIALVHAGWRGIASGIVEAAIRRLMTETSESADLWLHGGPAICGTCYEVGPEVHRAVHPHRDGPAIPTPIDLRHAIAERAVTLGIPAKRVTLSAHCTRCGDGGFFSHRGGSAARQIGVLGMTNDE